TLQRKAAKLLNFSLTTLQRRMKEKKVKSRLISGQVEVKNTRHGNGNEMQTRAKQWAFVPNWFIRQLGYPVNDNENGHARHSRAANPRASSAPTLSGRAEDILDQAYRLRAFDVSMLTDRKTIAEKLSCPIDGLKRGFNTLKKRGLIDTITGPSG